MATTTISRRDDELIERSRPLRRPLANVPDAVVISKRDPTIDVLRGAALLMIFVDHSPGNVLSMATLHNFGFSDAAEVFVFLAGMSAMLAYGKGFERNGAFAGLRRIIRRCARIYFFQIGLLLTTLIVVPLWTTHYQLQSNCFGLILDTPVSVFIRGLLLQALPSYLDILPLYLALFAAFPLIYFGLRFNLWLTLTLSATLWLVANLDPDLNFPNWINHSHWFFDPFAWQFLFTFGAVFASLGAANKGALPRIRWIAWLCVVYLGFAFLEAAPWAQWNLPDLRPFALATPDKTLLAPLRLLDILSFAYLLFSVDQLRAFANWKIFRPLEVCGRHSLEVFAVGCIGALFGRLLFRTHGVGLETQVAINVVGISMMCLIGLWLEKGRIPVSNKSVLPAVGFLKDNFLVGGSQRAFNGTQQVFAKAPASTRESPQRQRHISSNIGTGHNAVFGVSAH
jgi:hypothetical protein